MCQTLRDEPSCEVLRECMQKALTGTLIGMPHLALGDFQRTLAKVGRL